MSDTPRTDSEWDNCSADSASAAFQMYLFAQKLERELADARECLRVATGNLSPVIVEQMEWTLWENAINAPKGEMVNET